MNPEVKLPRDSHPGPRAIQIGCPTQPVGSRYRGSQHGGFLQKPGEFAGDRLLLDDHFVGPAAMRFHPAGDEAAASEDSDRAVKLPGYLHGLEHGGIAGDGQHQQRCPLDPRLPQHLLITHVPLDDPHSHMRAALNRPAVELDHAVRKLPGGKLLGDGATRHAKAGDDRVARQLLAVTLPFGSCHPRPPRILPPPNIVSEQKIIRHRQLAVHDLRARGPTIAARAVVGYAHDMETEQPNPPEGEPEKNPQQQQGGSGVFSQPFQNQPVAARVPEKVAKGIFTTGILVQDGPHEFVLDFMQGLSRPPQIGARVILAPGVMDALVRTLSDNLNKYIQVFGPPAPLPKPPQPQRRPTIQEIYENYKLPEELWSGNYANSVLVGHAPAEFFLDFITGFYPTAAVSTRVYFAAQQAPRMLETLRMSMQNFHRRVFGQGHPQQHQQPSPPPPEPPAESNS